MVGMGVSKIDTGIENIVNPRFPHGTYNKQIPGTYLGTLPPIPERAIFSDMYKAALRKLDRRGRPVTQQNITYDIGRKMPGIEVTQELIDKIMNSKGLLK
jgi:hypothetical protein